VGFQEALESTAPDLEVITAWQQRIAHSFLCLFLTIRACDVCDGRKQKMPDESILTTCTNQYGICLIKM
jgi:hypothetical protein